MKIRYKLTDQKMQTYGGCQWELDKWKTATGDAHKGLCCDGWLHCYSSPPLAAFLNPIHAGVRSPRLFEVEVLGDCKSDRGLKEGHRSMRLVREIPYIEPTTIQRIAFGILCAQKVVGNKDWNKWAADWLSNKDRSKNAAAAADAAAAAAAADAAAAYAAYAAADAAAAYAAAYVGAIDLEKIAEQAMGY